MTTHAPAPTESKANFTHPKPLRRIGVMAALHDELSAFLADAHAHAQDQAQQHAQAPALEADEAGTSPAAAQRPFAVGTHQVAGRSVHSLRWQGLELVVVLAGIGKVAAATTATLLADRFAVDAMVFTGVAGGLAQGLKVGDVVVADALLQHDMDASPLFPRHEVPLSGLSRFVADAGLSGSLHTQAQALLGNLDGCVQAESRERFALHAPRVHRGLVVSGDRFVSTSRERDQLLADAPDALVVEMEGAAVAQVCHAFGLPLAVVRTVSDLADDSAHVDFPAFTAEVASHYSARLLHLWLDAQSRLNLND